MGASPHPWQSSHFQTSQQTRSSRRRASSQKGHAEGDVSGYHAKRRLEMSMYFPIAIHKDPDSDYGVTVPDLPGCFSAGSTIDEAMLMAKEAIELYIDTLVD